MIRHLVLFSARRDSDLETIRSTLSTLGDIPSVRGFELGENRRHDELSQEVDLVVHAVFDDEEGLEAYKAHPIYRRSVEVVRPLRDVRIAVDYVIPDTIRSPGRPGRGNAPPGHPHRP